jgi:hypothetical protein
VHFYGSYSAGEKSAVDVSSVLLIKRILSSFNNFFNVFNGVRYYAPVLFTSRMAEVYVLFILLCQFYNYI